MKRNVALAGAVLGVVMAFTSVAKAETAPTHSGSGTAATGTRVAPTDSQKQARLFQLVNACLAERPGAPSVADDILRRFRSGASAN